MGATCPTCGGAIALVRDELDEKAKNPGSGHYVPIGRDDALAARLEKAENGQKLLKEALRLIVVCSNSRMDPLLTENYRVARMRDLAAEALRGGTV